MLKKKGSCVVLSIGKNKIQLRKAKDRSEMNDVVLLIVQELVQQIADQMTMKPVQVSKLLIQLGGIKQNQVSFPVESQE